MKDYEQLNLPLGVPSKPFYKSSKRSTYTSIPDPFWQELSQQKEPEEVQNTVEITPQQVEDDRWNPDDFGEVPRKLEPSGQLTIFYDSDEPPDPDDYESVQTYHRAWVEWRTGVGAQVTNATKPTTIETRVGAQVTNATKPTTTETRVGVQVVNSTESDAVKTRVGAQVQSDTKKIAPQHDDTHWVEKYWVERSGNKYWYYRYCWMVGRKKSRCYIGSVRSPIAQQKKQVVEDAIADGQSPIEIKQMITSFST